MKILITGSTGLLGSRIASFLSDIGHTIILGSRDPTLTTKLFGCNIVKLDFSNVHLLASICQSIDVVIHCSGMNASDSISDPYDAFTSNSLYAANLAQACNLSEVNSLFTFLLLIFMQVL